MDTESEGSLTLSDEVIAKLEDELAGLRGPARLSPLLRLGQALFERFWRVGPAAPAGLPHLNAAIAAMEEAYGYMRADDGLRGNAAAQLGLLLTARHSMHTEVPDDRDHALRMLEEALATGRLPAVVRSMCRVQIGQLSLNQAFLMFQAPGVALGLMNGNVPPGIAEHADRAVSCFREVAAEPAVSAELTEVAESMLSVSEAMQLMVCGTGAAGFDMQRMTDAMTRMQKLRDRFASGAGPGGFRGTGSFLSFADFQAIAKMAPLDRPVAVVQSVAPVVEGEVEGETAPVRQPAAPAPPDRDELRRSLRDRLGGTAEPLWALAAALLPPDAPMPAVDVVDEVAALAEMIVDLDGGDDGAVAEDRFVLAVALCLRDRVDEDSDHADRLAGAENLLAAVRKVPLDHPGATTMLRALGAFLTEDNPFGGVLDVVAEDFADRIDAVITARVTDDAAVFATLHALRCLCRAAVVMADLGRAPVPSDYPWHTVLKAASRLAG